MFGFNITLTGSRTQSIDLYSPKQKFVIRTAVKFTSNEIK